MKWASVKYGIAVYKFSRWNMTENSMMERNSVLIDTDALYSSNMISKYAVFDYPARVTHKYLTRDK